MRETDKSEIEARRRLGGFGVSEPRLVAPLFFRPLLVPEFVPSLAVSSSSQAAMAQVSDAEGAVSHFVPSLADPPPLVSG